ncbi:MAG: HAD family hydrolase [Treponema sp.]|jgi:putative hydrolase of the HAD superfamily|nr:HAD family hydrolase [Treponema sp.]
MRFSAIAFDLDGTLYPNYRLNIRIAPFLLRHWPLAAAFGRARGRIRREQEEALKQKAAGNRLPEPASFYEHQAELVAAMLNRPPAEIKAAIEDKIYRAWAEHFRGIRLFSYVRECLEVFRSRGLPLALLSDFPPDIKLRNLGIMDFFSLTLCSEELGALKPDPLPFMELARRLNLPPEKILYVGNSLSYDAEGALRTGMQAALVGSAVWKKPPRRQDSLFYFRSYRQLQSYVLS